MNPVSCPLWPVSCPRPRVLPPASWARVLRGVARAPHVAGLRGAGALRKQREVWCPGCSVVLYHHVEATTFK